MKITDAQTEDLLALTRQDQKLAQLRSRLQVLNTGVGLKSFQETSSAANAELLQIQNQFEAISGELKKTEADLATVVQRIERDRERLNQSSSPKDIQGIEAELVTLNKRKADLEDVELAQLEEQEDTEQQLHASSKIAAEASKALAEATAHLEAEIAAVRAEVDELSLERGKVQARLGAELTDLYERKAARGIPVGRLSGGECGACRMQIGAVDLDNLLKSAADDVVFCPECQAILVRS
ncbi:MAG: hypothetical protein RL670_1004 [Actinomycetota bacterium]|jgi:predicted  nucleic acid-binding Zn-ribbon protein